MGSSSKISLVNPDRLKWCLNEYQVSPDTLASATQISIGTIRKLLDGTGAVTFRQLNEIADYFQKRIAFFFSEKPVPALASDSMKFRHARNAGMTLELRNFVQRVKRHRQVYLDLLEDFGVPNDIEFVKFSPPDVSELTAKAAGEATRMWLEIEGKNTFADFRVAVESKGVLVFQTSNYPGDWKMDADSAVLGFCLYYDQYPVIVIRKQATDSRQSFTLMHELAHLILHKTNTIDEESFIYDVNQETQFEMEANTFASYVLVPESFDRLDLPRFSTHGDLTEWLRRYNREYGISIEALYLRLLNHQRISVQLYREYRDDLQNKLRQTSKTNVGGSRHRDREPAKILGEPYTKLILDAWRSEAISTTKASQFLDNLKLKDLHQLRGRYEAN